MTTADYIVIAILLVIVGGAVAYIIKAKRSGQKCIGCPDSKTCSGKCQSCSATCGHSTENKEN